MNEKNSKRVLFITFSNIDTARFGDAVNDKKFFEALPDFYNKIPIYPSYTKNNKIPLKSVRRFIVSYLKALSKSYGIVVTRGNRLAFLPILLKKFYKYKVFVNLGCSPLWFVERKAFSTNWLKERKEWLRKGEYEPKTSFLNKLYYKILEPQLEKYTLRNADKIIVENDRAKKLISHYGANKKNIEVIPYYVQDYFFKGNSPEFNINNDYFKIGYTGRFKKYDLLDPIIEAIGLLIKEKILVKLYFIGDGPTRKIIQNLVKNINLTDNIIFLGSKSHEEVSDIMTQCHCLLLPMVKRLCPSTIAIKILEGVIMGKIILTTNSGNNPSLFLDHTDLIMNEINSKRIAEKIKLVIKNYDEYKNLAENIKKYHINFRSKDVYEKKVKEIFLNISNF